MSLLPLAFFRQGEAKKCIPLGSGMVQCEIAYEAAIFKVGVWGEELVHVQSRS